MEPIKEGKPSSTVSFGSVRVTEHKLRLGDNPSVTTGLPVMLGEKTGSTKFNVDSYEFRREERGGPQPPQKYSKEVRDDLVKKNNHSRSSMVTTRQHIKEIKLSRMENNKRRKDKPESVKEKKPFFLRWIKS